MYERVGCGELGKWGRKEGGEIVRLVAWVLRMNIGNHFF
jgi:hypothetical protein